VSDTSEWYLTLSTSHLPTANKANGGGAGGKVTPEALASKQKKIYSMNVDEKALFQRLDEIIALLREGAKAPSKLSRLVDAVATGVGILGIIGIIEVLRNWLGG